ncbi:MAG TPA: hypothetical protein VM364_12125 [Vicinamibacterales bacterium]|nr:hypothetical protein [Vicinamibacterales bacterium]
MRHSGSRPGILVGTLLGWLLSAPPAAAQTVDLTVFAGLAFPAYDERLNLRASAPTLPGVDVTVAGSPVLRADGGPVFGAALALELGILGIEGRIDATDVGFEFTGARYDLRGTAFPFQGLTASIIATPGRFDADRIRLLSLNARIRTPGAIGVVASGGVSYLPDIRVTGAIPLAIEAPGLPPLPGFDAALTLRATPGQSRHRLGVNGGAGVRIGGRVALVAEARGFYFRDYELRFGTTSGPELLDELLAGASPVRFTPVFFNAQAGLTFRF